MKSDYKKKIMSCLKKAEKPLTVAKIKKALSKKEKTDVNKSKIESAVEKLKKQGQIIECPDGYISVENKKFILCSISKLATNFGFAKNLETEEEYFIPGRDLMGAMPDDKVLVKITGHSGNSPEGEVIAIMKKEFTDLTGNIIWDRGMLKIVPDTLTKYALDIYNPKKLPIKEGDKVLAVISRRGRRHSEHECTILEIIGDSSKASVCAESVVVLNGLSMEFPEEVIKQAEFVNDESRIQTEAEGRLDLRHLPVFTIDGADTKDIDDAIHVEKNENGFKLGVHIADVSHYVTPKSPLDNEAIKRGTSVYYANKVIPMLPKELSNGICSLNPDVDRLAFSCLMDIDKNGEIKSYRFEKTVIRSRVKGVYDELNQIYAGELTEELKQKYEQVLPCLDGIKELAEILNKKKISRGTPELDTTESKLIIDENDVCIGVKARERGLTQEFIEDFMLSANECAAKFGMKHEIPFVYRVHESPSPERIEDLKNTLALMNIQCNFSEEVKQGELAELLKKVEDTDQKSLVNNMVLRSMAKAKYSVEPLGHYGLALADYAHFTSPIRRYADLSIHRIMSEIIQNHDKQETARKYNKFSYAAADAATKTELVAIKVERTAEDCYKAEYMNGHIGEEFDAVISSVTDFGMFAQLENTCEGLIHVDNLPMGYYVCNNHIELINQTLNKKWKVGQKIRIKVLGANVSMGNVDFELA